MAVVHGSVGLRYGTCFQPRNGKRRGGGDVAGTLQRALAMADGSRSTTRSWPTGVPASTTPLLLALALTERPHGTQHALAWHTFRTTLFRSLVSQWPVWYLFGLSTVEKQVTFMFTRGVWHASCAHLMRHGAFTRSAARPLPVHSELIGRQVRLHRGRVIEGIRR